MSSAVVRDQLETAHVAFFAHFRDRMHWLATETRALSSAVSRPPLSSAEGGFARSHLEREVTSTVGELEARTRRLREQVGVASAATMLAEAQALFDGNEAALSSVESALEPYGYVRPPRARTPPRAPVAPPQSVEAAPELELPPSPAWEGTAPVGLSDGPPFDIDLCAHGAAELADQPGSTSLRSPASAAAEPQLDENLPPSPGLSLESLGLSEHSLRVVAASEHTRALGPSNCGALSPAAHFGASVCAGVASGAKSGAAHGDLLDLLGSPLPALPDRSPPPSALPLSCSAAAMRSPHSPSLAHGAHERGGGGANVAARDGLWAGWRVRGDAFYAVRRAALIGVPPRTRARAARACAGPTVRRGAPPGRASPRAATASTSTSTLASSSAARPATAGASTSRSASKSPRAPPSAPRQPGAADPARGAAARHLGEANVRGSSSLAPRALLESGGSSRLHVHASSSPRVLASTSRQPLAASPRPSAPLRGATTQPSPTAAAPSAARDGVDSLFAERLPYSPPSLSPLRTTALARAPPPTAPAPAGAHATFECAARRAAHAACTSPPRASELGGAPNRPAPALGVAKGFAYAPRAAEPASSRLRPISPAEFGRAPSFLRSQFEFLPLNAHLAQISAAVGVRAASAEARASADVWTAEAIAQATGLAPLSGDAGARARALPCARAHAACVRA